jgi:protocatechuate 3,4-dioxygenase beta subunit
MKSLTAVLLATLSLLGADSASKAREERATPGREPIIGLPCEGCEAVFEGLPQTLSSRARIAPKDEPGEPIRIEGTVRDRQGRPAAGVIVYAYHTDVKGIYPGDESLRGRAAYRHGRLRGWTQTDGQGRYVFDTIRPAGYPDSGIPAHVHMIVIEPGCCAYFIDDIHFDDDPRLSPDKRKQASPGVGGPGIVTPRKDSSGVWVVGRDILLGEKIPGYPPRAGQSP